MRKALWGVVLLMLVASACAERRSTPSTPIAGQGSIRGTVWNRSKGPMQGARVTVSAPGFSGRWETLTDAKGQYLLEGLPAGPKLTMSVKARGFRRRVYEGIECPAHVAITLPVEVCQGECYPDIRGGDQPPIDLRDTSTGATVSIDTRTGEPEPHPR